ncbi:MAG: RNA methyltransferase, TrmH family [Candidatus Nomurabacteria bacterium GW2011_GWB1_37_5]|uniref:RNA methyltransferase, TrmH family n=1 Tax=Candidatus Nomurabacteria bacterium GW2011_GWB1_37_5 TaxID=1618742 RepID=A0A0G0JCL5_9BACT|nr:MAG: RNA methyltransferase, TrmH family [Candidatus Nomurabacteria bacterium GW2011_GWB1_37_5]
MKNNENNYIYGKRPVEELLMTEPSKVQKIFIKKTSFGKDYSRINDLASKNKIPVSFVDQKRISEIAGGEAVSQGVAALVNETDFLDLDNFIAGLDMDKNPAVILLDELEDPHNVGAIIRTASAAGINGLIMGKHRQAPITAAVFKVSAGTAAKLPLIRVSNINNALDKLKDAGFWVMALDQDSRKSYWQQDYKMPLCFVVGNEGEGIREKTLDRADFKIKIPMKNEVESLNVSVSAALVMYERMRQVGNSK